MVLAIGQVTSFTGPQRAVKIRCGGHEVDTQGVRAGRAGQPDRSPGSPVTRIGRRRTDLIRYAA